MYSPIDDILKLSNREVNVTFYNVRIIVSDEVFCTVSLTKAPMFSRAYIHSYIHTCIKEVI